MQRNSQENKSKPNPATREKIFNHDIQKSVNVTCDNHRVKDKTTQSPQQTQKRF